MTRVSHGRRRWTQIIVGTSRTSITAALIAASSSVISIAPRSVLSSTIWVHAFREWVPGTVPRNE